MNSNIRINQKMPNWLAIGLALFLNSLESSRKASKRKPRKPKKE